MTSNTAFFVMRLNDHVQYLNKVTKTLEGKAEFEGTSHEACKLGQWIYGDGEQEVAAIGKPEVTALFESLKDPHQRFHDISHEALEKYKAGDQAGAEKASTEMHILSTKIYNTLLKLDTLASR